MKLLVSCWKESISSPVQGITFFVKVTAGTFEIPNNAPLSKLAFTRVRLKSTVSSSSHFMAGDICLWSDQRREVITRDESQT